jgi:hypothetical protein
MEGRQPENLHITKLLIQVVVVVKTKQPKPLSMGCLNLLFQVAVEVAVKIVL